MRRNSVLYALLKPPVNWACRLFYRNLHVRNSNRLYEVDAPVLLISNHQNALMDPLLCCITSPKQLNFLTRADVFKKPLARKILFRLNMLPVYRPHDKVNIIESNAPTFRESLNRLENNQVISLFPEGTHQKDQNLKPFKKGAARLIGNLFDAGACDRVIIQPVGLHFTHIMHSGYPGFVHFGEQEVIHKSEIDLSDDKRSKTVVQLTERMRQLLEKHVIHIEDDADYAKKLFVFRALQWHMLFSGKTSSIPEFKELENQLDAHLPILESANEKQLAKVHESSFDMPALVLAGNMALRKKFGRKLLSIIPIYSIGFASTALPYYIGKVLSKKLVKDICFTSTAKIITGTIFIPLFWSILMGIALSLFSTPIALMITASLVFCGAIFLKYHTSYRILARANTLKNQPEHADLILAVKNIVNA